MALTPAAIAADLAYDSAKIRAQIEEMGVEAVIPSPSGRLVKIAHDEKNIRNATRWSDIFLSPEKWAQDHSAHRQIGRVLHVLHVLDLAGLSVRMAGPWFLNEYVHTA